MVRRAGPDVQVVYGSKGRGSGRNQCRRHRQYVQISCCAFYITQRVERNMQCAAMCSNMYLRSTKTAVTTLEFN